MCVYPHQIGYSCIKKSTSSVKVFRKNYSTKAWWVFRKIIDVLEMTNRGTLFKELSCACQILDIKLDAHTKFYYKGNKYKNTYIRYNLIPKYLSCAMNIRTPTHSHPKQISAFILNNIIISINIIFVPEVELKTSE